MIIIIKYIQCTSSCQRSIIELLRNTEFSAIQYNIDSSWLAFTIRFKVEIVLELSGETLFLIKREK